MGRAAAAGSSTPHETRSIASKTVFPDYRRQKGPPPGGGVFFFFVFFPPPPPPAPPPPRRLNGRRNTDAWEGL